MRINSNRYILYQTLLWGIGCLLLLLFLSKQADIDARYLRKIIFTALGASFVVFINLKWLITNLYLKNKRGLYLMASALLLLIVVWIIHSDLLPWNQTLEISNNQSENPENSNGLRWLIRNLPPPFICLLGSSLLAVGRYARVKENELIQQEKSKLETELKFLKSQINPHFLFNALNNIYALTITRPELASDQLLKLSDILRYMLYDSNETRVPLEREIDYLRNYLSFVQLKDSRGMDVSFNANVTKANLTIAPLLFIPFVENAFKHGQIEDLKNGFIHITLKATQNHLTFEIENSIPGRKFKKDEVGGIGIKNVEQRLELLYPGRHFLNVEKNGKTFKVHLKIQP